MRKNEVGHIHAKFILCFTAITDIQGEGEGGAGGKYTLRDVIRFFKCWSLATFQPVTMGYKSGSSPLGVNKLFLSAASLLRNIKFVIHSPPFFGWLGLCDRNTKKRHNAVCSWFHRNPVYHKAFGRKGAESQRKCCYVLEAKPE